MKNEFITYEQAVSLKELGFDEPCFGYYLKGKNELNIGFIKEDRIYNDTSNGNCLIGYGKSLIYTPSYSQAFRWFRDNYDLKAYIIPIEYLDGTQETYQWNIFNECHSGVEQFTYEEAESACLDKLIEIVKNK